MVACSSLVNVIGYAYRTSRKLLRSKLEDPSGAEVIRLLGKALSLANGAAAVSRPSCSELKGA
eukprot:4481762-Prorocentrum_lima.AAC.1